MPKLTAYISSPSILINGRADDKLSDAIQSVLVEETTEGLCRCEALFNNYGLTSSGTGEDYLYAARSSLNFGADFAIHMPLNDSTTDQVFRGKISALEAEYLVGGGALMMVLAEDQLQSLRMTRRTRTFELVSDEDVMRQIAQEHRLTPQLNIPQGPIHKVLAQVNQSNLAFMRERARNIGVELWVADKTLHAQARTDRAQTQAHLELAYGANLLSFSVRADLAHQCSEVCITGWNVDAKDAIEEQCDQSAIQGELEPGNSSGSTFLLSAFGARKEYVVHTVPLSSEEARSIATARYRERARRFVTGTGVARGDARIRVGCSLFLGGLGSPFNGTYYVTCVRHSYDGVHGYRTTFDVERPGMKGL